MAAERIGYFTTGILAGVTALEVLDSGQIDQDEQRFAELCRLGVTVSAHWHPVVADLGESFPYAAHVASSHEPMLETIQQRLAKEAS